MPGVDTTFVISGPVQNSAGMALVNRPVNVTMGYHQFDVDGNSKASEPTQGEMTDGDGNYTLSWRVTAYDATFGFSVVTKAGDKLYLTTKDGEYLGHPTDNPATIVVSKTILDPNPNPGGG